MSEQCENCKYWHNRSFDDKELGDCRRFPPVVSDVVYNDQVDHGTPPEEARWVATEFPTTIQTEWCGEWKGEVK